MRKSNPGRNLTFQGILKDYPYQTPPKSNHKSPHALKSATIPLPPNYSYSHNTMRSHKPYGTITMPPIQPFPRREDLYHRVQNHPMHPKSKENEGSQIMSNQVMKQKLIHKFSTFLTHATTVYQHYIPLNIVIYDQSLILFFFYKRSKSYPTLLSKQRKPLSRVLCYSKHTSTRNSF